MSSPLLVRDVEIDGRPGLDCLIQDGRIEAVDIAVPADGADVISGRGGALLPGLADHHLHLLAMAAAASSVDLAGAGPWRSALQAGRPGGPDGWVRATGWDEGHHGDLDRRRLDEVVADRPVRVQHRSGALWVLNSRALELVGPPDSLPLGAERDAQGEPNGRLWRSDAWLRGKAGGLPELATVGAHLARLGITAVTDASPDLDDVALRHLAAATMSDELPQRVTVMTAGPVPSGLGAGPRKIVVADHALPDPDDLARRIASAHDLGRPVAVHCVSQAALVLTVAALAQAGPHPGDRIEHCAEADVAAVAALASAGVVVVTQPSLVHRRGDDYLDRHDRGRHGDLWRYGSLLGADIRTVASSDAPYGDPDPWLAMRVARDRRTSSGRSLGAGETVTTRTTLDGYLAAPDDLRGGPRRIAVAERADVVLLRRPMSEVLRDPSADLVAATIVGGRVAYLAAD